jgi:mannose-1-phosphate guanylyltransferase
MMDALLLAAGVGSRLRPLTKTTPKCLVAIHGRPLLDYWATMLREGGVERILINTHWLADQVEAFVAAAPWRDCVTLVHEPELLGTGGTVKRNSDFFREQDFLLAHADNLTDFDVAAFLAAHDRRPAHCAMTMLAFRSDDPRSCGILELDGDNVVQAFHEKVADPPGNLANGAVYIFGRDVVEYIDKQPGPFVDLSMDIIPMFMGRILAVETKRYHRDIGNLESLRRAELEYKPGLAGRL